MLVAGGARGLTGAPCLAAEAAQRAGAGYVTACVPAAIETVFEVRLLEVMTRGLPDDDGAHTEAGVDAVLELAAARRRAHRRPGPGPHRRRAGVRPRLVREAEVAVVLDADGLNAHAGDLGALAARPAPTVLTPHEGELGRLLGIDSDEVKARRLHHVREAAAAAGAIVVLKGDDTLVAEPGGTVAVSPGASAALATAGTGDVLSGVIGRDPRPRGRAVRRRVRRRAPPRAGGRARRGRARGRRRHRPRRHRGPAARLVTAGKVRRLAWRGSSGSEG